MHTQTYNYAVPVDGDIKRIHFTEHSSCFILTRESFHEKMMFSLLFVPTVEDVGMR